VTYDSVFIIIDHLNDDNLVAQPAVAIGTECPLSCKTLTREEVQQLASADPPAENRLAALISTVRVKNMLGDIQANRGNFRHGRLPQVVFNTSTLAHRCRRGASPPSPNSRICVEPAETGR